MPLSGHDIREARALGSRGDRGGEGMKRNENAFWLRQKCPDCGHVATTVYTPDLLLGPVQSECMSKYNPCARECSNLGWGLAIEIGGWKEREIRRLLRIADRMDRLLKETSRIREELRHDA